MLWLLEAILYQVITVNQTTPCFLNQTQGADIWKNCGITTDYLQTILLPWEWITGGNFSMFIVAMFIGITYIKYHKAVYPILIGVMFLPISFFLFPAVFISWAIVMALLAVGIGIWYAIYKQTKDY